MLGAEVQRLVTREVRDAVNAIVLARVATVATATELGASPTGTRTGPNGTQNIAAVWLDDDPVTRVPVVLPVRPGITLTGGEVVRIERNSLGASWAAGWVDGKV